MAGEAIGKRNDIITPVATDLIRRYGDITKFSDITMVSNALMDVALG